ncbi:spondin domain-containing protein [Psychromonas antarctica]|uniref:spondin domain-containing protein n=1 Tax=Psychromonas antarctica TaxID=67573 RepID=UPI001EE96FF8|nr:spondin domain-containing protein [Psychromonas antarctica]
MRICNDDMMPTSSIYEVSLTNITQGQIFSPPAVLAHTPKMPLWTAGASASVALEALAEGGDTSQLSALPGIEKSIASTGPILPGETMNWTVELSEMDAQALSLATMLINTNDGFTGLTDMDLSSLAMGESYQKMLIVYDAGTEMNDEIAMPGSGGEAFNTSRMGDVDRVYAHAGVLTSLELSSSVLLPEHKFDNPAGKLIIKRVQ